MNVHTHTNGGRVAPDAGTVHVRRGNERKVPRVRVRGSSGSAVEVGQ